MKKIQYNLINNKIFNRDSTVIWQCLVCGFLYEGLTAPSPCPVCGSVGSYKYYGDNVVLYMTFNEPDGSSRTVIVENEDPTTGINDIKNKMDTIINSGLEGPNLTKDNTVVSVQNSQSYPILIYIF
ncbi:MAG: rubredoxin-like domain-containing protein [Clostridium sp.]